MKKGNKILGIDPGLKGAIVLMDGGPKLVHWPMPHDTEGRVDWSAVHEIIDGVNPDHVFLERALAFGMGVKGAFNYGRDFKAIEIAIDLQQCPVTFVESHKWTKALHQGISNDLKPKVKSAMALKRLLPQLVAQVPVDKKGNFDEGVLDAALIAYWGRKELGLS